MFLYYGNEKSDDITNRSTKDKSLNQAYLLKC